MSICKLIGHEIAGESGDYQAGHSVEGDCVVFVLFFLASYLMKALLGWLRFPLQLR